MDIVKCCLTNGHPLYKSIPRPIVTDKFIRQPILLQQNNGLLNDGTLTAYIIVISFYSTFKYKRLCTGNLNQMVAKPASLTDMTYKCFVFFSVCTFIDASYKVQYG